MATSVKAENLPWYPELVIGRMKVCKNVSIGNAGRCQIFVSASATVFWIGVNFQARIIIWKNLRDEQKYFE